MKQSKEYALFVLALYNASVSLANMIEDRLNRESINDVSAQMAIELFNLIATKDSANGYALHAKFDDTKLNIIMKDGLLMSDLGGIMLTEKGAAVLAIFEKCQSEHAVMAPAFGLSEASLGSATTTLKTASRNWMDAITYKL